MPSALRARETPSKIKAKKGAKSTPAQTRWLLVFLLHRCANTVRLKL